jgi:IS1 family transposase
VRPAEKLVVAWHLGRRDRIIISKVRWATAPGRFEVCTDGFSPYVNAIADGLHDRADYLQVVKVYAKDEQGRERYSPGEFVSPEKTAIMGQPDLKRASTSHVERQNGTLCQWCKRLTRLTYAF